MLPIPSPILFNNTMDKKFLLRVEQSNKCGSVTINKVCNWPLGSGAGPLVSIPCLLQDTCYIYWFNQPKQSPRNKQRIHKKLNPWQVVCNCLGLHTQNPELKKVHFTSSAKVGSDKSTMLKKGRNTREEKNHRACTNIWFLAGHNKRRLGTWF